MPKKRRRTGISKNERTMTMSRDLNLRSEDSQLPAGLASLGLIKKSFNIFVHYAEHFVLLSFQNEASGPGEVTALILEDGVDESTLEFLVVGPCPTSLSANSFNLSSSFCAGIRFLLLGVTQNSYGEPTL